MKRVIAMILTLTILFSMTSMIVWAEEENTVEANSGTTTVSGSNDFGDLVADVMESENQVGQNAAYDMLYSVYDVQIADNKAVVSYTTQEEAQLVVAIYTDNGVQMITSATAVVSAEKKQAELTFPQPLPETFLVKAYLLDTYDYAPLATAYENPMYTAAMQELLAAEISDFADKNVLRLDNSNENNFAVYTDEVICIPHAEGINTVVSVDEENAVYVIENADTWFTSLRKGDLIAYNYGVDQIIITRVADIKVDGTTVTITGDDLTMEEVFTHVKIQAIGGAEDMDWSAEDFADGITYDEKPSTRALEAELPVHLKINLEFQVDSTSTDLATSVTVTGDLDMDMDITYEFYMIGPLVYMDFYADTEAVLDLEFSAELDQKVKLLKSPKEFNIYGIVIGFDPEFHFTVSLSAHLNAPFTFAFGATSYNGVLIYRGRDVEFQEMDSYMEGKIFVGFNLRPYVGAISGNLMRLEFSLPIGLQVTCRMKGLDHDMKKSPSTRHTCKDCLDISVDIVVSVWVEFKLLDSDKLKLSVRVAEKEFPWFDKYYSFDHNELGDGKCPYEDYRVTFVVVTTGEEPVAGATITLSGEGELGTTNESGTYAYYLEAGTYTFRTSIENEPIVVSRKIDAPNKILMTNDPEVQAAYQKRLKYMVEPAKITNKSIIDEGETGEVSWVLYGSGQLVISGEGRMGGYSYSEAAPWYEHRRIITSAVVENGVTYVGSYAFDDLPHLAQIIFGESVERLDRYAVRFCPNLRRVQIPIDYSFNNESFFQCPNINTIHYNQGQTGVMLPRSTGFSDTNYYGRSLEYTARESLTTVVMDEGITGLAAYAFYYCSALTNVYFPVSYETNLPDYAFYGCSSIEKVDLPYSLTRIGESTFEGCTGMVYMKLPIGLTYIGSRAFMDCEKLKSITIPDEITYLGSSVFTGAGLTEITLPVDYPYANNPFNACKGVTKVHYTCGQSKAMPDRNNKNYDAGNYDKTLEYNARESLRTVTFDSNITRIGNYAFAYNSAMTAIEMPEKLTEIGQYAFYQAKLETIDLKNTQSIGSNAFYTSQLKSTGDLSKVTYIGSYAYAGCENLASVTIPDHLANNIGNCAFSGCSNLKTVTVPVDMTVHKYYQYGNDTYSPFYNCPNIETIHYTKGLTGIMPDRQTYTGKDNCYQYSLEYACRESLKQVRFNEGITKIGNYAFWCNTLLERVVLPESLDSIGSYAFHGTAIKTIDLKNTKSIGESAFQGSALAATGSLANVTHIGANAYSGCINLTSVTIPDHLANGIGSGAFSGCTGLKTVTVPVDLFVHKYYQYGNDTHSAFYGGELNIETIHYTKGQTGVMPDRQTYTGKDNCYQYSLEYACRNSLKEVSFAEGVTRVGDYAFWTNTLLEKVTLPESLEAIGQHAFHGTAIKTIDLKNTKSIGESAFQGSALTTTGSLANVTYIGTNAYSGCVNLTSVTIPDHLANGIGSGAFSGCTGLKTVTVPVDLFVHKYYQYGNDTHSAFYGGELNIETIHYTKGQTGVMPDRQTYTGKDNCYQYSLEYACRNSLKQVSFAYDVTHVGSYAFYGCAALSKITFQGAAPSFGNGAFYGVTAQARFPKEDASWTESVRQNYYGTITWISYSRTAQTSAAAPSTDDQTSGSASKSASPQTRSIYGGEYKTDLTPNGVVTTAYFTDLVPGREYVLLALASLETEDLLAADNLLYIQQAAAQEDGTLTFAFIMREYVETSYVMVCGPSGKSVEDAQIIFPEMTAGEAIRAVDPTVIYNGITLKEEVDYIILGEVDYTAAGTYTCYIRGIREYTGLVTCTYTVNETTAGDGTDTPVEQPLIPWLGVNVELGGALAVNFALDTAQLNDTTGNYIELTRAYADGTTHVVTIAQSDWNYDGRYVIATYQGLAAKEMGDQITAILYNAEGTAISETRTDSIASYSLRMLQTRPDIYNNTSARTLFVDMLNYGAAAQVYFGYDTENLVNAGLSTEQAGWASAPVAISNYRVSDGCYAGSSLTLEDQIYLMIAFHAEYEEGMKVRAIFTNHYGNLIEQTLDVTADGSFVIVRVEGMVIADFSKMISCTLYSADGAALGSTTDSMESYVSRMANDLKKNGADLGDAIAKLGASAYAYFH